MLTSILLLASSYFCKHLFLISYLEIQQQVKCPSGEIFVIALSTKRRFAKNEKNIYLYFESLFARTKSIKVVPEVFRYFVLVCLYLTHILIF